MVRLIVLVYKYTVPVRTGASQYCKMSTSFLARSPGIELGESLGGLYRTWYGVNLRRHRR